MFHAHGGVDGTGAKSASDFESCSIQVAQARPADPGAVGGTDPAELRARIGGQGGGAAHGGALSQRNVQIWT